MNLFVSAGEVSGDQALASILARLRLRLPDLRLTGLGGDASAAQGLRPLAPMSATAVSGVGDVLRSALALASARRAALRALEAEGEDRPDLALLVDYPGLNLELARRARRRGIPVYYVAPPQAWIYKDPAAKAARASRSLEGAAVHVLFPFERETFAAAASETSCGHFLSEALEAGEARETHAVREAGGGPDRRLLALCPGSRLPALRRNLPAWLNALRGALPGAGPTGPEGILILVPPHLSEEARALAGTAPGPVPGGPAAEIVTDKGRIFREASWAIAFPGTVTLELALAGVPAATAAALDPLTMALGRRVVKGPWLGLPNLLLGREAFPEWMGPASAFRPEVASALWQRLRDLPPRGAWAAELRALMGPASGPGVAAEGCLKILEKSLQIAK